MCKKDQVTCANIIGIAFTGVAIAAAAVALIMDQLTWFLDPNEDDEITYICGWQDRYCEDEDASYCSPILDGLEYEEICDDLNFDEGCDTQECGEYWFYTVCAGILFCLLNIVLVCCLMKKVGSVVGMVAAIAFGLAVCFWAGLDVENFDWNKNALCYDHDWLGDESEDEGFTIFPGLSMMLVMASSLFAMIGAVLSCSE